MDTRCAAVLILSFVALAASAQEEKKPFTHPPTALDRYFDEEVWAKVGEQTCLKCHHADGDASDSRFVLEEPTFRKDTLPANRKAFERMARMKKDGTSRILLKVTGGLKHGGKAVVKRDSTSYRILEGFVRRLEGKPVSETTDPYDAPPFFDGIGMMAPERLLRRVTLSLAARLPSDAERTAVRKDGLNAFAPILDALMNEQAFYDRLHEGWNDVFMAVGYDDVAESALSYDHFKERLWYQQEKFPELEGEKKKKEARRELVRNYRSAIYREPYELINYIVRNDRPFTELVTADYMMMSPLTARGYGIFAEVRDRFEDPEDPFEFIPVQLPALKHRNGRIAQPTPTGRYPHAGILTMFQYLRRYPTTVTNRNRLRVRMFYQHFLGIDIMALAPRVTDAAAVAKQYKNPTLEAPDCVVCHIRIDPLAGLFQDYFSDKGYFKPRKEGWFTDMFPPGFEDREKLPEKEKWRSLQWLGERTARDPRFAVAMVEHVYYFLLGRRPLVAPIDIDHPMFASKRRAYRAQRRMIEEIADRFARNGFNFKDIFKDLVASEFYRVDGLAAAAEHPRREAELHDLGVVRLLTPEQVERKLKAIFGQGWGRLDKQFRILYGGIDSKQVTERITDPGGAMGAIQRMMANAIACKTVPVDFSRERSKRILFPGIEPDVTPGSGPRSEEAIRNAIVHLHARIIGRAHGTDHPEVNRTYQLFTGILEDARAHKGLDTRENYSCKGGPDRKQHLSDPNYTLRAWRAVVTYLLRQHDFLYE